jgi:hypothetical protein
MQPRQNFEVRSRFGNYLILALDQKMRYAFLQHFYLTPNLSPLLFLLNGILSPVIFYKISKQLFNDARVAKISLAIFLNTIGYYSLTSNMFMAAKPIGVTIILISILLTISIFNEKASSIWSYKKMILAAVIFFGFFVDEIVFIALFIPFFLIIYLSKLNEKDNRLKMNKLKQIYIAIGTSFVLWVITITFIIPLITQKLFNWKFDFWGFNLNLKNDINFGGAYDQGTNIDLIFVLKVISSNFMNITNFQVIPHWLFIPNPSVSYGNPNSLYRFGEIPNLFQIIVIIAIILLIKFSFNGRMFEMLIFFGAYLFSIFFTSILQLKHVPEISTYVYGSSIAIFSTLLISSFIKKLIEKNRWLTLTFCTMLIIIISTSNAYEFNKRWDLFHRNWSIMNATNFNKPEKLGDVNYLVKTSTSNNPSWSENYRIWQSYHNNNLNSYLKENQISLQGWALVAELRIGDAASKLNDGVYHCNILNIELECLGYKAN